MRWHDSTHLVRIDESQPPERAIWRPTFVDGGGRPRSCPRSPRSHSHETSRTSNTRTSRHALAALLNRWFWMRRLEPEVEREVRRLAARGHTLREIGRMLGCSRHAVTNTLGREPRPATTAWNPSPAQLSLREREEIRGGRERATPSDLSAHNTEDLAEIARSLADSAARLEVVPCAWRAT
jgi:hypothetical protein